MKTGKKAGQKSLGITSIQYTLQIFSGFSSPNTYNPPPTHPPPHPPLSLTEIQAETDVKISMKLARPSN